MKKFFISKFEIGYLEGILYIIYAITAVIFFYFQLPQYSSGVIALGAFTFTFFNRQMILADRETKIEVDLFYGDLDAYDKYETYGTMEIGALYSFIVINASRKNIYIKRVLLKQTDGAYILYCDTDNIKKLEPGEAFAIKIGGNFRFGYLHLLPKSKSIVVETFDGIIYDNTEAFQSAREKMYIKNPKTWEAVNSEEHIYSTEDIRHYSKMDFERF